VQTKSISIWKDYGLNHPSYINQRGGFLVNDEKRDGCGSYFLPKCFRTGGSVFA